MHDLEDPAVKNILASARRGWSPQPSDAERVRRAVGTALARGAGGSTAPVQRWRGNPWLGRVLITAAFTAAGAAGGYWAGRRAAPSDSQPAAVTAPSNPAAPGPQPTQPAPAVIEEGRPAPAPAPSIRRREPARARSVEGPAPTPAESLAVEVRALRNVERALRDHKPGLASAYLDNLNREVPGGQMREERAAQRALARCAQRQQPFGVDLADDFAAAYPASAYRGRVHEACGRTDSNAAGDSTGRR